MKIVGSDKGLHSPEFHKKKTRERRIKLAIFGVAAIVIVAVPVYLARTHRFLISSIEVAGNDVTKSEEIQSIIASDLSGDYLWIFPRSNAALYPKGKIISDLRTAIPRLSTVTVELKDARSLSVSVTEREPVALYCRDVSDPTAPSGCYFADETGRIFSEAPSFSGDVYLVYAQSEPLEDPIGKQILPPEAYAGTLKFVKDLANVGIYPRVVSLKPGEYHYVLSNGAELITSSKQGFDTEMVNLEAFFSEPSIIKEQNFLGRVAYIDMRFDGKIFYKFRE